MDMVELVVVVEHITGETELLPNENGFQTLVVVEEDLSRPKC